MKRAVIFDMDGVLVDNRDVHIESFKVFCERNNHPFSLEKLMSMFGMNNREIMPQLLPELTAERGIERMSDEKEAIYREIYSATIQPVAGLVDFIKELKHAGFLIAVGSSGNNDNVNFVLERCGIAQYFDAIANGDMITKGKPDPEVFLLAAELLKVEPQDCVVIEDSFAGIEAARRAGMKVIALATTSPRDAHSDYDFIADDFTTINVNLINKL